MTRTEKVCFTDGDKIGVFDGEKTALYESEYILRAREYAETRVQNDEWKYGGDGARFRGDYELYNVRKNEKLDASVNGVQWVDGKVVYSFTVGGSSGVYCKNVSEKNAREEHILSTSDEEILSLHRAGRLLAVTVMHRDGTSSIGTLDLKSSELKTLTEGDSRDANPYFSPVERGVLYFDSAGLGRDAHGEFTGKLAPAAILSLDTETLELKEVLRDKKYAYVKPKIAQDGTLYCIKRPNKERGGGNVFFDILLFPFRILKAIFGFLQPFVLLFGHTSLTSQTEGGSNPARGREQKARDLYIDGCKIEAEKELKRNRRKNAELGFIPASWKLIRLSKGTEETVRSGVCDFSLTDDGLYCTDGRHIFFVTGKTSRKIADAERCLCVATESRSEAPDDLFRI